jgi:hypothetical protein
MGPHPARLPETGLTRRAVPLSRNLEDGARELALGHLTNSATRGYRRDRTRSQYHEPRPARQKPHPRSRLKGTRAGKSVARPPRRRRSDLGGLPKGFRELARLTVAAAEAAAAREASWCHDGIGSTCRRDRSQGYSEGGMTEGEPGDDSPSAVDVGEQVSAVATERTITKADVDSVPWKELVAAAGSRCSDFHRAVCRAERAAEEAGDHKARRAYRLLRGILSPFADAVSISRWRRSRSLPTGAGRIFPRTLAVPRSASLATS